MSKRSRKAQVWIAHVSQKGTIRILMFKVVDKRGGAWHPVTGGIDEGEEFLDGAKREVEEETGFNAKKGRWIDLKHAYHFEGSYGKAEEHSFLYIVEGTVDDPKLKPKLDPSEHVQAEWIEVRDAEKRVQFDGQRNALQLVSAILKT